MPERLHIVGEMLALMTVLAIGLHTHSALETVAWIYL